MRTLDYLRDLDHCLRQGAIARRGALQDLDLVPTLTPEHLPAMEEVVAARLSDLRQCRAALDYDVALDPDTYELLSDSLDQTIEAVDLLQAEVLRCRRLHAIGDQMQEALAAWWSTPAGIEAATQMGD